MRYLVPTFILITLSFNAFSQDTNLRSVCNCLDELAASRLNKVDFQFAHEECFNEIYSKAISLPSQESSDAYMSKVMGELKAGCPSYDKCIDLLSMMTLTKSETKVKDKTSCKQVMQFGEFEDRSGNEKVIMIMQDSLQTVTFGDPGLYTKSKIVWTDECTYKAIFIESTNPFENNILKKGDEREISIIDIKNGNEVIFEVAMYNRWFLGKVTKLK